MSDLTVHILLWAKSIDNFKFKFPGVSDRDNRIYFEVGNSVSDSCAKVHVKIVISV